MGRVGRGLFCFALNTEVFWAQGEGSVPRSPVLLRCSGLKLGDSSGPGQPEDYWSFKAPSCQLQELVQVGIGYPKEACAKCLGKTLGCPLHPHSWMTSARSLYLLESMLRLLR